VIGATMLVETDVPEYQISWWVIGVMAALSAAVLVLVLGYTIRAYRRPTVSGAARMVGAEVPVLDWSGRTGHVRAEGERWQARSEDELAVGATARVRAVDGLTLVVDPAAGAGQQNGQGGR
jgi:membrane-bound serine protease (ClpP class)